MVNVDLYSDERALDAASVATEAQPDIQAVGRAAQILNLFSNETPELTVGSVAQRLGLNRTTAHRYLSSLVAAGLVRNSESGHTLVPGELAVQLGAFALARRFVLDLASGPMSELSESARMTVVLSIWGLSGPVVAQVHENRSHAVVITVPVGTQLSLDTAQSVLYMANSKDQLAKRHRTRDRGSDPGCRHLGAGHEILRRRNHLDRGARIRHERHQRHDRARAHHGDAAVEPRLGRGRPAA
jgi:DNA-binding IclR family transcriptional regulator